MYIKKSQVVDMLIYILFLILVVSDWISSMQIGKSILVMLTFLVLGILCFIGFISENNFVSIDTVIYIFMFLFAYYAPLHQYITGSNIHSYATFSDLEYLFGNTIILIFLVTYMLTRRYLKHKKKALFIKESVFCINDFSAVIIMVLCILCFLWLYTHGEVFSFGVDNIDISSSNDTIYGVVTRIIRFFPAASVFLFMSAIKKGEFITSSGTKYISNFVVYIIFFLVFNPVGGVMNRYILFGTFLMLLSSFFENNKHKSFVLLGAVIGFYLVFPAFNFFKYNSFTNISQFTWGGFDVNTNDYDSYQVFLQAIRYVNEHGLLFGKNIISALFCIIPRSVWSGKSLPSGQIITEAINARFTNVSCPLFAEFYLAFGVFGVVIGTILFANIIKSIEYGNQMNNYFYRGLYYITIGIIMSFMRGAMLPVTSYWYCWIISFSIAYFICTKVSVIRRRL